MTSCVFYWFNYYNTPPFFGFCERKCSSQKFRTKRQNQLKSISNYTGSFCKIWSSIVCYHLKRKRTRKTTRLTRVMTMVQIGMLKRDPKLVMVFSVAVSKTTLFPRTRLWMFMAVTARDSGLSEDKLCERTLDGCVY